MDMIASICMFLKVFVAFIRQHKMFSNLNKPNSFMSFA